MVDEAVAASVQDYVQARAGWEFTHAALASALAKKPAAKPKA